MKAIISMLFAMAFCASAGITNVFLGSPVGALNRDTYLQAWIKLNNNDNYLLARIGTNGGSGGGGTISNIYGGGIVTVSKTNSSYGNYLVTASAPVLLNGGNVTIVSNSQNRFTLSVPVGMVAGTNNVYPLWSWVGSSNVVNLNNSYQFYSSVDDCSITGITGRVATESRWATLIITNAWTNIITVHCSDMGSIPIGNETYTDLMVKVGGQAFISIMSYGTNFSSYINATSQ